MTVSDDTRQDEARVGRPGRGRDPSLDAAIKAGALQVLESVGYHRFTTDAVAAAAGVGKATIHGGWAGKDDLLVDLIKEAGEELGSVPNTGSLREDLRVLLTRLAHVLVSPEGRPTWMLTAVLMGGQALTHAYQDGPLARWRQGFTDVLGRAVERGEVGRGEDTSRVAKATLAILLQRSLVLGRETDPCPVAAAVDEVMMSLLER